MKVDVSRMGSVVVVAPHGAIATAEVDDFAGTLEDQRRKTNGRFVLDFSQVSFLDSAGVEAIWNLADRQREAGQTTRIAAVPELCREIFELTGVVEQLDLFDTPESAVRSFL